MDKFLFYLVFSFCLNACDKVYAKSFLDPRFPDNNKCDKKTKELRIKGQNVKFSEFINDNRSLKTNICTFSIQKISIFASSQVIIDIDFTAQGFFEIFIIAPTWKIINTRKIMLKGETGKKAVREGTVFTFGYDGKEGFPGGPGGNFFGVGEEFINGEGLTINVDGGDGSDGLNGGDGMDGKHGESANKEKVVLSCRWQNTFYMYSEFWLYGTCHEGQTLTKTMKGEFSVFECSLEDNYPTCNYIIKGKPGRPSTKGGHGGAGGDPGNPGSIRIVELTKKSGFKQIKNFGKRGRDGRGGRAGKPGSNGLDIVHTVKVVSKKWFWFMYDDVDKVVQSYYWNSSPMTNGVDGKDGFNRSKPAVSKKLDLSETANIIVDYKEYLREGFHDEENIRVQFYNKLENNENILTLYNVLAFVKELHSLEKQYHRLNGRLNFLTLYRSLSNRTIEFAKKNNSESRSSMQHKKVLTFLYTTIMSREYNLKDRSESNLIVEMGKYLDLITTNIQKYKAASRITTMEMYRSNYVENIDSKIKEANDLIQQVIMPEIDKAVTENRINVETILEEIIRLQKESDDRVKELQEAQKKLESKFILSLASGLLDFIAPIVAMIPTFGVLVATGISVLNKGLKEYTRLNYEVGDPYTIKPPMGIVKIDKSLEDQLKGDIDLLQRRVELIVNELRENPEEYMDLLKQVETIRSKIDKVKNRKDVWVLKEELKQVIEEKLVSMKNKSLRNHRFLQLNYNKKQGSSFSINKILKTKKKKDKDDDNEKETLKKRLEVMNTVLVQSPDALFSIFKNSDQIRAEMNQYDDAIKNQKQYSEMLRKFEEYVIDNIQPALEDMAADIKEVLSELGGKSHASLDVTKWQLQSKLKAMNSGLQQVIQNLNVSESFLNTFKKIEDALNVLVNLYERIQSYQDNQELGNLIADINSAGAHKITVSDPELQYALAYLDTIISCNIVVQQYHTAIDAFKQYVFPLANLFIAEFILPNHLDYGEDLEGLILKAETQIHHIKQRVDEYSVSTNRYDTYTGRGHFKSGNPYSKPFFVWDYKNHKEMITKLLAGEEVTVLADITKSDPRFDAIKFNVMEFNFQCKNNEVQSIYKNILNEFEMSATHLGNSYYRNGDQYYLITTGSLEFWYSFFKEASGEPIHTSNLYYKMKKGDYMLSPFASWKLQLTNNAENNPDSHKILLRYKDSVDLLLEGYARYVHKKKLDIDIQIDNYYTPIEIYNFSSS